jgi:hypothetical protein
VSSLGARINPFETTQAYIDRKITLVEALKIKNEVKKIPKVTKVQIIKFIDISIIDNIMHLSAEYKLKKWFILENENKIIFDYISQKQFYTKEELLSNDKYFNKVIIGAHPENNYFRVVIETKDKISEYKINVEKEGSITIFRK